MTELIFLYGIPSLGMILSIFLYLSPIKSVMEIYENKEIRHINPLPYPCLLLNAILWTLYGAIIKRDHFIYWANDPGILLTFVYVLITFSYIPYDDKNRLIYAIFLGICGCMILLSTYLIIFILNNFLATLVIGIQANIMTFLTFLSPLSTIYHVFQNKNSKSIDWKLSIIQLMNSLLWSTYGLYTNYPFIYVVNSLGVILALIQLITYLIFCHITYPKKMTLILP